MPRKDLGEQGLGKGAKTNLVNKFVLLLSRKVILYVLHYDGLHFV